MLGMHGTYEANMTMHNADVIFAVGVRFDDRTTNNLAKYCPNATVLHIDIDPTSISKTVTADIPIVGDARQVLEQMLELLSQESAHQPLDEIRDWWQQIEQWRARQCLKYDTHSEKIKPQAVIETLWRLTKGDAYVTSDVGQHQMFCCTLLSIRQTASLDQFRWPRHDGFLVYLRHWASKWRCQKKPWFASLATAVFR
ncbi:acetolactate synthase 3 catalytic subunit [Escherichia coli]|uniref:Acetolactate synthase 3 catalytic subunit n=1 Tax=Escherichia coli TaxID=562 RepID=A0A377E3W7_ECOLX|nr:acetolactate synthase 3 catalytic subunit [Escherichia coli]